MDHEEVIRHGFVGAAPRQTLRADSLAIVFLQMLEQMLFLLFAGARKQNAAEKALRFQARLPVHLGDDDKNKLI